MAALNLKEITRDELAVKWETSLNDTGIKIPYQLFVRCNKNGEVNDWKKALIYFPQELPFIKKKRQINIH